MANESDGETQYVTKSGKVLTDEDIQLLADEAEAGYDIPGWWKITIVDLYGTTYEAEAVQEGVTVACPEDALVTLWHDDFDENGEKKAPPARTQE